MLTPQLDAQERATAKMVDDDAWQHDRFGGAAAQTVTIVRKSGGLDAVTKLLISNLHPGVTTLDVQARERPFCGLPRKWRSCWVRAPH